jgi:lipopolysaccharide exporter
VSFTKKIMSNNIRNIGKVSLGTIIGQLISIISLPILIRIYGATVIGYWALFNSIAIIVNSFSDLGLTNAIMMEDDEKSARNLYKVISTISLIVSLLIGICSFFFTEVMFEGLNMDNIFIAITISILVFNSQQIQVCYTWLNRRKDYNTLMKNPVINNSVAAILAIILGLSGYKEFGYYVSFILGQVLTLLHMKRFLPTGLIEFNINQYRAIFKKHSKFIIYQMPSNIILQIKTQIPTLLISTFFGATILGYYSVAMRVLGMPITLLAKSIGKVFFQRASEIKREGGYVGEFCLRSLKKAMKISMVPIVLMLSLGDIAIVLLFGSEFIIAANIFRIMTFYALFLFLSMSVNGIAIVIDKQKYLMYSGIFQILGISSGIWIGATLFNNIYVSVLLLSLTFVIIQVVYFCSLFKVTNVNMNRYLSPLIIVILLIALMYIIIRLLLYILGIVDTL